LKARALYAVAVLGLLARAAIVFTTMGSNDVFTWEGFAQAIDAHGLGWLYANDAVFNHPPLMGAAAWLALKLSAATGLSFVVVFRLPALLAELGIALLLYRRWEPRGALAAAAAVALYAWSLNSILIAAFHGNTDVFVAAGCLLACALLEGERRPFAAGLALGAAINVKLVPVLLILPFAIALTGRKSLARFTAGLALMALPFAVALAAWGQPFAQHVLGYRSSWENWGFAFLLQRWVEDSGHAAFPVALREVFFASGTFVLFAGAALVGVAARRSGRIDRYEAAALTMALFLIAAPGFAVQYTIYAGPLLFAVSLRWGALYGLAAGGFAAFVYWVFLEPGLPYFALFRSTLPMAVGRVGLVAWGVLLAFCAQRAWALRRSPPAGWTALASS
jgi:Glycosyltransferase family 87